MAAATLDMCEVRKSQRRHAALLSGVYPFGHPLLVRLLLTSLLIILVCAALEEIKDYFEYAKPTGTEKFEQNRGWKTEKVRKLRL